MKLSRTNFLWQLLPKDPVHKSSSWSVHPAPHLPFLNTFGWWDPYTRSLWVAIQVQTFPTCSPTAADLQRKGTQEQVESWAPLNIWKHPQETNCWAFRDLGDLLLSIASNPRQCKRSSDGDEPRLEPLTREEFGLFLNPRQNLTVQGEERAHAVLFVASKEQCCCHGVFCQTPRPRRCSAVPPHSNAGETPSGKTW